MLSACPSPLGLCLLQFHSPVARDTMISLSSHQQDNVREIVVEAHDRGINLRACLFTRTCWVMFLAMPLDFQTCEIIAQAVGHFGTVTTWTNNSRCKSRVLVRCSVTMVSRSREAWSFVKEVQLGTLATLGRCWCMFSPLSRMKES